MNTRLSRFARIVLWFVAINALIGATILIFFPTQTEQLFFWNITPPINAALFGALYLGGALVVGWVTYRGEWEGARFLTPVLVSAGILISLTTFLHLDRFNPGLKLAYWLIVYVGAPLLALLIYRQQESGGANWIVEEPLRPITRHIAVGLGGVLLLMGLAGIAMPGPVVANWPWPTSPLMVRIFAAWFSAFGVGLLWFHVDRDWRRVRLIPLMMVFAAGLDMAMVIIHRADVSEAGMELGVFVFHLGLFGAIGLIMIGLQRRRPD